MNRWCKWIEIIKMLLGKSLIQARPGYVYREESFPLDGYDMDRNLAGPGLEYLQTYNGINEMNCWLGRAPIVVDRMFLYYHQVGPRINYVVNENNYDRYQNAFRNDFWHVSRAIMLQ